MHKNIDALAYLKISSRSVQGEVTKRLDMKKFDLNFYRVMMYSRVLFTTRTLVTNQSTKGKLCPHFIVSNGPVWHSLLVEPDII